ncbi:MAG: carbohydrate ABC transporter permease [Candidatus Promineifilaceae bacterium]
MSFMDAFQQARSSRRFSWQDMSPKKKREAKIGYAFIGIWIVGFLAFYLLPMVASFVFSLMDFQLATPDDINFVGFSHWQRMLFDDELVWESMGVTFIFAIISLPIGMIIAFGLAVLLNSEDLWFTNIFRTLFYMPSMVPGIAAIFIWQGVLNAQTGWLNRIIQATTGYQAVGLNGIRWLDDPNTIYIAYTYIGIWGVGNAILINLAGLQGVPTDLYEAAKVDGAGYWQRMWKITIPMVSPVIFYNLVLGLVGLLQYFLTPYVLNGGNGYPEGSTRFYMIHFFNNAFGYADMGYGAALAWLMFIVGLVLTVALFGTARYWVFYAGE